jgi:hypothetical protein
MGEAKRKAAASGRTLMLHNADSIADEIWENEFGTYNVGRGYKLSTGPYLEDLNTVYRQNGHLDVDRIYAARMPMSVLNQPILVVELDDGVHYMIDGRHRLEERHRRGMTTILYRVVPKEERPKIEVSYSIFENGKRILHTPFFSDVQKLILNQHTENQGETHG